jgi:hypothetical protein
MDDVHATRQWNLRGMTCAYYVICLGAGTDGNGGNAFGVWFMVLLHV